MKLNTIILLLFLILTLLLILIEIVQNKNLEYYTISDNDITEEICKKQFSIRDNGPFINPITNYSIEKNKKIYKELNKKCKKFESINKRNYKSLNTVPNYLKVLYKMLNNGYVKLITDKPTTEYNRKTFGDKWHKVKNTECDIRSIVLYKENKGNVIFSPSRCNLTNNCENNDLKCTIYSGEWQPTTGNYFINNNENPTYTFAKLIDVDHTVPLKHAYYAGGFKWNNWLKEKYANDLTPGHLIPMVYYLNTEKGDKDPSEWLPPNGELKYVSNWLAIKYRYGLIIQPVEFNVIQEILDKYQDFIPDEPINIQLDIGYETVVKFNKLMDPIYQQNRDDIINNYNTNILNGKHDIKTICKNSKLIEKLTKKHMDMFKQELLKNNNHAYFGLLRPEYVNLIKTPQDICEYI